MIIINDPEKKRGKDEFATGIFEFVEPQHPKFVPSVGYCPVCPQNQLQPGKFDART